MSKQIKGGSSNDIIYYFIMFIIFIIFGLIIWAFVDVIIVYARGDDKNITTHAPQ